MAGNFDVPCMFKDSEAKGAEGCVVIEFLVSFLGLLIFVYVGIKCCLGRADDLDHYYGNLEMDGEGHGICLSWIKNNHQSGSEDETAQLSGEVAGEEAV